MSPSPDAAPDPAPAPGPRPIPAPDAASLPDPTTYVSRGALKLHAWFYDVGTPELYEWNPETDEFQPVA